MSKDIYFGGAISPNKIKEMYFGLPSSEVGKITNIYAGLAGGVIGHIFQNAIVFDINSDVKNLDLYLLAGYPSKAINMVLRIADGVRVFCDDRAKFPLYGSVDFPENSRLSIYNLGDMDGMIGIGGNGGIGFDAGSSGHIAGAGTDGDKGDTVIRLPCDTTIYNLGGTIYGGSGGGGGGGGGGSADLNGFELSGCGGGGGAGYVGGTAGVSPDGHDTAPQVGESWSGSFPLEGGDGGIAQYSANGGNGGTVNGRGVNGLNGLDGVDGSHGAGGDGGSGGLIGDSINTNGFSLVWGSGGVDGADVRGSVV